MLPRRAQPVRLSVMDTAAWDRAATAARSRDQRLLHQPDRAPGWSTTNSPLIRAQGRAVPTRLAGRLAPSCSTHGGEFTAVIEICLPAPVATRPIAAPADVASPLPPRFFLASTRAPAVLGGQEAGAQLYNLLARSVQSPVQHEDDVLATRTSGVVGRALRGADGVRPIPRARRASSAALQRHAGGHVLGRFIKWSRSSSATAALETNRRRAPAEDLPGARTHVADLFWTRREEKLRRVLLQSRSARKRRDRRRREYRHAIPSRRTPARTHTIRTAGNRATPCEWVRDVVADARGPIGGSRSRRPIMGLNDRAGAKGMVSDLKVFDSRRSA